MRYKRDRVPVQTPRYKRFYASGSSRIFFFVQSDIQNLQFKNHELVLYHDNMP